jgi:hypothetical protein
MSGQRVKVDLDATVVVHVEETVTPALVGRDGLEYQSPPQPRAEALALVRLLLGRGAAPKEHEVRWRCPIAGGQRTITLEPVPDLQTAGRGGQPANGALP